MHKRIVAKVEFNGIRLMISKGLYWDGESFILLYKRYENGHEILLKLIYLKRQELANPLKGVNSSPNTNIHKAKPGNLYNTP